MQLRIIILTALCALAGGVQALAPVPAAAMDDAGTGSGECRPMTGSPGVYWNGTEFCTPPSGSGSGESGSGEDSGIDESIATVEIIGEAILVESTIDPCLRAPIRCLPTQIRSAIVRGLDKDPAYSPAFKLRWSPGNDRSSLKANTMRMKFLQCRHARGLLNQFDAPAALRYKKDRERFRETYGAEPAGFHADGALDWWLPHIERYLAQWNENDCARYLKAI